MSHYARIYRAELQELKTAPAVFRFSLRLGLTVVRFLDAHPRAASFILWAFSLWAVWYIFMNYHFTTQI